MKTQAPKFHLNAGYVNAFEVAIRFHRWATSLGRVPSPPEIAEKFRVCRSTAYRWRDGYMAAVGLPGED